MTSPGPHSALLVEIPEAEPVVRRHRELLDAYARLGVPAHITVLFPFMAPEAIDDTVLGALAGLFASTPEFDYRLDRTGWFDEAVVWLGPSDACPFRALTQRVVEAFPDFPPFEGQYDDVVPHLTLGHGHPLEDLRAAEKCVLAQLPVTGHASSVTLMTQQTADGPWAPAATFPLALRPVIEA